MKILLFGGYGSFGSRIVELLKSESKLCLVIAGRSLEKARSLCARHGDAQAKLVPLRLDREFRVAEQLREIAPDWVIDASGPFQAYGEKCYAVIEACIAAKVHYLDLADGSEFVKGVSSFDERAKLASVFVLSGVSS